jgi:hypothetical protein
MTRTKMNRMITNINEQRNEHAMNTHEGTSHNNPQRRTTPRHYTLQNSKRAHTGAGCKYNQFLPLERALVGIHFSTRSEFRIVHWIMHEVLAPRGCQFICNHVVSRPHTCIWPHRHTGVNVRNGNILRIFLVTALHCKGG